MPTKMPTREDLIQKLKCLRSNDSARTAVSAWAVSIIDDDSLQVTDALAWDVLKRLGAVDLPAPDQDFLYTAIDFEEWQKKLENSKSISIECRSMGE